MSLDMESDNLEQTALLWEAVGVDDFGVITVSATPVEVNVRWNETKGESSSSQQSPISKTPDVIVDRDIPIGSIMWLGGFLDVEGTGTSTTPEGNFKQVTKFSKIPDIKGDSYFRSVGLTHFGDLLPETV